MPRSKFLYLLLLTCWNFISVCAQNNRSEVSLKLLLQEIEKEHQVVFNYIEDEIVLFKIAPPNADWPLERKIKYLTQQTRLQFKLVGEKYYSVYNNPKFDKPLCGFLLNEESLEPIENAVITMDHIQVRVFSGSNGYFELPLGSPHTIRFTHQSFDTKMVDPQKLYAPDCVQILLKPHYSVLDEVVAERFMTSGIAQKKNGSISIKPQKFGLLPGLTEPDVLQTLQQLPGVNSTDETISNMSVRGGSHDQNLFLWNGIRMFQTGHFFGLISAFNPSLAHEITFTKNGTSAFYGESVSSLAQISTHRNQLERSQVSSSINLISAETDVRIKLSPKAYFEVSGRRSLTDFFDSPTYDQYNKRVFQNTIITDLNANTASNIKSGKRFYFYDVTAHYLQKIGTKHELSIDAITIRNTLGIDQYTENAEKFSRWGQENLGTALGWKTQWTTRHSTQLLANSSYYKLSAWNESVTNNQLTRQNNSVLNLGLQIQDRFQWTDRWAWNNGYILDELGVTNADNINEPAFSRNIKNVSVNHAGVTELAYKSGSNKTRLSLGMRLNYYGKTQLILAEPRFFWEQSLTDQVSFHLSGEYKSQSLQQVIDQQRDFLGLEKRRWVMADGVNIPIQKSQQAEVGLRYKNKSWLLSFDTFYKKVQGITAPEEGFQNQFEFSKAIGNYEVLGTEIFIQKSFNRWYTWLSGSFNQNNYQFETLYDQSFPNNYELAFSLSHALIYEFKSFKLALGTRWHTGKPYTTPASNIINNTDVAHPSIDYNAPNNARLSDYLQVNASISKSWQWASGLRVESGISMLNLLNKANLIHRYYRINAAGTGIENIDVYALARTPNVNLKVSF